MAQSTLREEYDVIVIGGGPAGLAAALAARDEGAGRVLLLERNASLGGILNQCIHNGFGLHHFGEELTGPEYAERFIHQVMGTGPCGAGGGDGQTDDGKRRPEAGGRRDMEADGLDASSRLAQGGEKQSTTGESRSGGGIEVLTGAMVLELTARRTLKAIHPQRGYLQLAAKAVLLAMGCRERTRGAIAIPGTRPAGIFTAGAAQLYMNLEGFQVGRRAVILGSGDIGLIMARRLTLEGASVEGVYELMPYSGGLTRNIVQCLDDYGIPLHLSHTITEIRGDKRVEQVVVQQVGPDRRPVEGTQRVVDCDTVLLSVGLIPENELSRGAGLELDGRTGGPVVYEDMECSVPGIFACGNVAHVHDLVDFVTAESLRAGKAAARYCAAGGGAEERCLALENGEGVAYTVPQRLRPARVEKGVDVFFRVREICREARVVVRDGEHVLASFKREHLAPGEMEKITLPWVLLDKAQSDTLQVCIEEGV